MRSVATSPGPDWHAVVAKGLGHMSVRGLTVEVQHTNLWCALETLYGSCDDKIEGDGTFCLVAHVHVAVGGAVLTLSPE